MDVYIEILKVKKTAIFTLCFFMAIVMEAQVELEKSTVDRREVRWESSYKEALKRAKNENKPVLVYFSGSDWCGPCIKLDKELFHTLKFTEFAKEHFVLYLADFPRNKDLVSEQSANDNKKLAKKHKNSFPMVLLLNAKEKVLGEKRGSYVTEYYYTFFEEIIKKYYTAKRGVFRK